MDCAKNIVSILGTCNLSFSVSSSQRPQTGRGERRRLKTNRGLRVVFGLLSVPVPVRGHHWSQLRLGLLLAKTHPKPMKFKDNSRADTEYSLQGVHNHSKRAR